MGRDEEDKVYLAIDLKSFYASVECVERGRDPLTTHLVVADAARSESTICLAVTPALKAYGVPGHRHLPEIGGLEVQQQLLDMGSHLPIILVSGFSEIPSAVEAIKKGAFDFLEKPVDGALLVAKVQSALARSRELHAEHLIRVTREARLALLTVKEREIAELVVAGKSSPKIAQELDISVRTVENHRARLMEKLRVESIAELVRLFL